MIGGVSITIVGWSCEPKPCAVEVPQPEASAAGRTESMTSDVETRSGKGVPSRGGRIGKPSGGTTRRLRKDRRSTIRIVLVKNEAIHRRVGRVNSDHVCWRHARVWLYGGQRHRISKIIRLSFICSPTRCSCTTDNVGNVVWRRFGLKVARTHRNVLSYIMVNKGIRQNMRPVSG